MQFSLEQLLHVMRGPFCLWLLSGHKCFETALLYLVDVRPSLHEYEDYGLLCIWYICCYGKRGSAVAERRISAPDPHLRHCVVSLSKAHLLPIVLVKPRKQWLRPDMTEKLLTGT